MPNGFTRPHVSCSTRRAVVAEAERVARGHADAVAVRARHRRTVAEAVARVDPAVVAAQEAVHHPVRVVVVERTVQDASLVHAPVPVAVDHAIQVRDAVHDRAVAHRHDADRDVQAVGERREAVGAPVASSCPRGSRRDRAPRRGRAAIGYSRECVTHSRPRASNARFIGLSMSGSAATSCTSNPGGTCSARARPPACARWSRPLSGRSDAEVRSWARPSTPARGRRSRSGRATAFRTTMAASVRVSRRESPKSAANARRRCGAGAAQGRGAGSYCRVSAIASAANSEPVSVPTIVFPGPSRRAGSCRSA